MKKSVVMLLALFVANVALSGCVTRSQAFQKAKKFLKGNEFIEPNKARGKLEEQASYYIFNEENALFIENQQFTF